MKGQQSTTLSDPLLSLLKRGTVTLLAGASSSAGTRTACLTSSSIDWAKDSMVSFSSTSVVVVVVGGGLFELCHGHALEPSPGGTGPDSWPATGGWYAADDFPPNLLLSQLLALVVVCTVAPSCWNQQEPHIPRKWRAFVPRAVLLFEIST